MTAYKNFVADFPRRCRDILHVASKPALSQGLEVTLALVVASAGLVVPYERLKPNGRWGPHPSGESEKFVDAAKKLESILHQPFMSSSLWTKGISTWCSGELDSAAGEPDSWAGLQKGRPISKDKTLGAILSVIRNALAH